MIKRVVGLGLFLAILNFLTPTVFHAIEDTIVSILNIVKYVEEDSLAQPSLAIPQFPFPTR